MKNIKSITVKFIGIVEKVTYGTYEEFASCPYVLWDLDVAEIRILDSKGQTVIFDNKEQLDEYLERMALMAGKASIFSNEMPKFKFVPLGSMGANVVFNEILSDAYPQI